ncbi:fibronectin type III domain-containing protein, partial [Candidatus Parcubacteria bacterium]|nr:fibronectin type III domain-containing protein [Patescibacteria group bacterium]MBU4309423.1 fibronectin type III domain-containing protein [Patescibacteria group bacterium]MBU4431978.1 fibronectin type III domain-containing protein [Patescibacteria group bacterium]MBU4577784.1 fibronectin type III domain-containing protein [Patescibacteria group bacterium]MCG2697469.1 fibronectin type III domain-containing protein [Candidatus Parcubacteria bacterium]
TVQEGQTDRLDSDDLPINFTIKDAAGNQSPSYTTADATNRPGVDAHTPTNPGNLSFVRNANNSVTLLFGSSTTESNFKEYKIYYKVGTSGVTEGDSAWTALNDANLNNINYAGATTTTITGLNLATTYVFNIWAYDLAGNKAVANTELSASTNNAPAAPTTLLQLKADGATEIANGQWQNEDQINLKASANDSDTSEVVILYFELLANAGSFTTATTAPVGACASGVSFETCTNKIWSVTSASGNYSATPFTDKGNIISLPTAATGYKWQVLACDDGGACSNWSKFNLTIPNVKVDAVNPTTPGNLTINAKTNTSVTLNFGATTTEDNFLEYQIFYKVGGSGVTVNDLSHSSSTDINLANINFNGATTTLVQNLAAGTQYVFNIWAYDQAGNKVSATEVSITTDSSTNPPTGVFNSVAQKTDGSGAVDVSIQIDDYDNDDTLRARLDYVAGADCNFGTPLDPVLDTIDISADYGIPVVDNDSVYQVGTSTGWLTTSPGANTINFDWLSKSNIPNQSGLYCLRLTVNDGLADQVVSATTTVYIDNQNPTAAGQLSLNAKRTDSVDLNFGASSTEENFYRYRIFYKQGTSGVTEGNTELIDTNLNSQNYNNKATTTMSGLLAGTAYVVNIWAYDLYGNKASATEYSFTTNYVPQAPASLLQLKNDGATTIVNSGWLNEASLKLKSSVFDQDTSEAISIYYQFIGNGANFTIDAGEPGNACSSGTDFSACASAIWKVSSAVGDYSVTPFTGQVTIANVPDATSGYKWQVLACDDNGVCSAWTDFNFVKPNLKIDTVLPTVPGNLSLNTRTYNSVTLNLGASTTESNFLEYRIYYKKAASGVTEADSLHASTSDANLAYQSYNGATTTLVTGLLENTQYVFDIWAYDQAGNKNKATEIAYYTNNRPTGTFSAANFRTNGSGVADLVIQVNDTNNDNSQAKVEYVAGAACNFASPLKPSLDQTDENATSTQGDAKILNSNTYQIGNASGWILTSGVNTVNFDWLSQLDVNNQEGTYCLRLTANDQRDDQAVLATTTVYIDNLAPTQPGSLSLNSKSGTSITLGFGATTTETNFATYKIFYREGASTVTESDTLHIDSDLSNINFNGTATTTVSGLNNNTQYSFKIYAYDQYGNKTASDQVTYITNSPPTGTFNSVAQKTNGSGVVDVSIEVYDVNGDTCTAKLEYATGTTCNFISPGDPTLSEAQIDISSDYGTVGINNAQTYQIGTSTGKIITSSGSNTVNFDWLTKFDVPTANGNYCLRLTVNDDYDNQIILATTTLVIDNVAPINPGSLSSVAVTGVSVTVGYGAATVDTNFSDYKIYYKKAASGVTEDDTEINSYDDSNLGNISFNSATTTYLLGLRGSTEYVFNIWAYDLYGNKSSSTVEMATTTAAIVTATWREAEDTTDPTVGNYIGKNESIRVRLALANSGDWVADNYQYRIEYGVKNGTCQNVATWEAVPVIETTEAFRIADSLYFNENDPTSEWLSNDGYNFVAGQMIKKATNTTQVISLNGGEKTEVEYLFQATANAVSGETYCFRATDEGGLLDTYGVYPELTLAPPPTGIFNSFAQKTDGTGVVSASIEINDLGRELNTARLEYVANANCDFSGGTLDPSIDEADEKTTADFGDPLIDNNAIYQIGTSTRKIVTQYGSNTVNFNWRSDQDLPGVDATYCARLTTNDGYEDQVVSATTTVVIDQVNPSVPADLFYTKKTSNSVTLAVATSTDTHFREYRIYYKEGDSGVTESDMMWASSSDPNLGVQNFNGATTTTVTGLETNKQYVFRIWAYDQFGNKAVSFGEQVVIIRYLAKSENWRWYNDQQNETPTSTMASEDVTPSDVVNGASAKLRIALHEFEGITGSNVKMRLQYSTYSDFSADVNFVGEISSTTAVWTYGNGVDNDGDLVSTPLLSGISLGATHNESGLSTSTYVHLANEKVEFEFTINNNDAPISTTYYFRTYDIQGNAPVVNNDGYIYPSLVTSAGAFTYSLQGFSTGSSTEGVVTNINSTANSMNFGTILPNEEAVGVHRFNISTNAGGGYQLFVYQKQNLISTNGSDINPLVATNESPVGWSVAPNPSAFGYHTGDDTLSGLAPSRFAPDDTYAKFETSMKEVSFSQIPVVNETVDLVYRLGIGSMQEAGDYETEMIYILVPTFYE